MYWVWVRISPGEGAVLGVAAAVKCIRLRKQQTPAAAHGSASRPMRGFRMDSPAAGVTDKCGGDVPFRRSSLTVTMS